MGTNYYWHDSPCDKCGYAEILHIGKQSDGWLFALHVRGRDEEGNVALPRDLDGWRLLFEHGDGYITDEHDGVVSAEELLRMIEHPKPLHATAGRPPTGYSSWRQFLEANYAELALNGRLRSRIDGARVVGHGATYDLRTGEFS